MRIRCWTDHWRAPEDRLNSVLTVLRDDHVFTVCGGDYDPWELETRGGLLGAARLLLGLEELGGGCQMVRFQIRPKFSITAL